jgi:ABC-type transport system involved in cytochrome c biogenesis permease component
MTFLPIVGRELRVAARRSGTYWFRIGVALVALAIGGFVMLLPFVSNAPQRLGIVLFVCLSIVTFIYSLLISILTTADCLSEEKRDGTLGLLFLTDLKGYDIVLGKLAASSLNAFYGMLAIFPVMAIPLLVGGVTGAEFWRVVLVSINNLFFSLAVGMFCSAVCRDERKAMVLTFLIIVVLTIGFPILGALSTDWKRVRAPSPLFFVSSPGYVSFIAFDETFKSFKTFNFFYQSLLCIHGLAWALLLVSCLIVPRTWQDKADSSGDRGWRGRWRQWKYRSPEQRLTARRRMLALNPFYWLAGRDRMKSVFVWMFLGAVGLLWAWGLWRHPHDWKDEWAYFWTGLIMGTVIKCWLGSEACRRFGADRKSGALELLLSTPLSVKEIIHGQLLALWKQFAAPAAVVLIADFLFLMSKRQNSGWAWMCVAGMIVFVADLIALSWLGMWLGLRSRHAHRAAAGALVRVLVLPWILMAILLLVFALSNAYGRIRAWTGADWEGKIFLLSWLVIGLSIAAIFGLRARQKLLTQFREVATQRFEAHPSRWRRKEEDSSKAKVQSPKSPQPQLG